MFFEILNRRFWMADSGGQGGNLVATTQNFVNAYTGDATSFDPANTMAPQIKTYYDTVALENSRNNHVYAQFAEKVPLPEKHGMTIEKRKPNTFGDVERLTEGVIPAGKKFGYTALTIAVHQYGDYNAISDRLELHAVDPVIQDAAEEWGAAAGDTQDKIARNVTLSGSNVMYCDLVSGGSVTEISTRSALTKDCKLTPTMVNRAATWLKKHKAPKINGKYVAIIHPSVSYDIRQSSEWIEAHKYATPENLYNGEIGELHGVRFVESDNAKVYRGADLASDSRTITVNGLVSASKTVAFDGGTVAASALVGRKIIIGTTVTTVTANTDSSLTTADNISCADDTVIYPGEGGKEGAAVYACIFLGAKSYAMIDVAGGNQRMIIKDKSQVGGPLDQFGTVGVKFETGGGVQYEERLLRVECGSYYSGVDEDADA